MATMKHLLALPLLAGLWQQASAQTASPSPPITSMSSTTSSATDPSSTSVIYSFSHGVPVQPTVERADAPDSQVVCSGYKASNVTQTQHGLTASLRLAGSACNSYGTDIDALNLTVEYQAQDRLHVEILPTYIDSTNASFYLPPADVVTKPTIDEGIETTSPFNDLDFAWGNDPSFWFKVSRRETGEELFSTQGSKIVFQNQFVEFKTTLPEDYNMYGLGETIAPFRLGTNYTKTMWNVDQGDQADENLYGTFPIYYETRYYEQNSTSGNMTYVPYNNTRLDGNYTSKTHGVYYRNPGHGQDILLREDGLTWRTIGGEIDLYFYSGPSVDKVVKQATLSAFGLPAMHQYYTLGYHQCRWGYNNWSEVEGVVQDFEKFGIPLETVWNDIDYMEFFRTFTLSSNRFSEEEGRGFFDRLHSGGRHYIPIVDSPIYIPNPDNASDAYATYTRGHEMDVFLLQNNSTDEYIGRFWPGFTVFSDWDSPRTQEWWTNEMVMFHQMAAFDGIWIDLSEIASQCVGSCGSSLLRYNPAPDPITPPMTMMYPEDFNVTNATDASSASAFNSMQSSASSTSTAFTFVSTPTPSGQRDINYPPYAIDNLYGDLAQSVVSPNASHHNGVLEYDVHNLYGLQIVNATYNALLSVFPGKRPFIIGRSTTVGSGKVGGHWGGDNTSLWFYMLRSISQAFQFSLFGVPMFGVDTCGFNANTDEELCSRWMQLSAFFTFYRNHNTFGALSQEPYRWASVADASKTAMDIRYALLPYMYTLMQYANTKGDTVMRALAWEFPNQPNLADVDLQLMLGPSILVTPVLEPNVSTVRGVFPGAQQGTVWYDWQNQTAITDPAALRGENVTIDAPLGHIPVYVRGGSVLPLQPRGDKLVTRDMRQQPWSVLVALDGHSKAKGSLYLDDGESVMPNATRVVALDAYRSSLHAQAVGSFVDTVPLANVTVLGLGARPQTVRLNNQTLGGGWTYDGAARRLSVTGLSNATTTGAWSKDWTLSWA